MFITSLVATLSTPVVADTDHHRVLQVKGLYFQATLIRYLGEGGQDSDQNSQCSRHSEYYQGELSLLCPD